jgi:hypothetical protein
VIAPRGSGAVLAQVPDGTTVGGNKRGDNAVDFQTTRSAATHVASGLSAAILGGFSNTASAGNTVVSGGSNNNASALGAYIGGGQFNAASSNLATIAGGNSNTASGTSSAISGGTSNTASGTNAAVAGGNGNTASGVNSAVPGGNGGNTRGLTGRLSFSSGIFSVSGDAQYGLIVLRRATADNTPTILTSTGAAGSTINLPTVTQTGIVSFRAQVVCIQTAGSAGTVNDCKAWEVVGAIKRDVSITTTALIGTPTITVIAADANLGTDNSTGAVISITADTGIVGAILINVTGETDKTLRWLATVHTTELDY